MAKIINDLQRARKVYGSVYRAPVRVSLQTNVESDAAVLKLDWKESVRAASTGNETLPPGSVTGPLDGVTLVDGNRILLKDQSILTENGIYVVNVAGGTWDRAPDAIPSDTLTCGATVYVEEGSTQQYTKWILSTTNANIPSGQTWVPFVPTGVSPASPANSVQFNNAGNFGGSANFTYDGIGRVEVTGSLAATMGLSGSLTQLVDGSSYLIAGANISITSASNGAVTISGFNDTFTTTFTDLDLVSGIFTANHNLNFQYATVIVYDDSNKQIIPDEVNAVTANSTDIDLTSFAPIPHTWTTTIIGGYNKTYTRQFVYADLVAGVLTVTHGLNSQYVIASVYDDSDNQIIPDDVTATSSTTLDIDLNTFGSFAGTWKVTVKA